MLNIKSVSDLRNYNEVLGECEVGNPVFLTKDGRGKYVIMDIKEYEKQQSIIKLMSKLNESEKENKWVDCSELNAMKNKSYMSLKEHLEFFYNKPIEDIEDISMHEEVEW